MSNEQRNFLSLPRFPGLISLIESCWLLGLAEHQGKILVRRGLLMPAGKRRRRKGWMFVSAYVLELANDRDWLNKARDTLSVYWEQTNSRKAEASRLKAPAAQT